MRVETAMQTVENGFVRTLGVRARAAGWHLSASLAMAVMVAALIFGLWYPGEYKVLAGGVGLFFVVMAVDVVIGPLLTFVIYDLSKGRAHLRRDILVIIVMQLLALAYGVHAMYLGRPVGLVFEFDRFRVVSLAEVVLAELPQAPPAYRDIPLAGPMLLAARKSITPEERADALNTAIMLGVDNSQRPKFWIPYDEQVRAQALAVARPLDMLVTRYPAAQDDVDRMYAEVGAGLGRGELRFLPVRAKHDAVVVLKPSGDIAGFLHYDGFF